VVKGRPLPTSVVRFGEGARKIMGRKSRCRLRRKNALHWAGGGYAPERGLLEGEDLTTSIPIGHIACSDSSKLKQGGPFTKKRVKDTKRLSLRYDCPPQLQAGKANRGG